MKIFTSRTAPSYSFPKEKNTGKSQTIPGQAITAQELLRKYATGQPLGFKNVTPIYDEDGHPEVPEFYKMDQMDRLHEMQEHNDEVKGKLADFNKHQLQQKQETDKLKKQAEQQHAKQSEDKKEQSAAKATTPPKD